MPGYAYWFILAAILVGVEMLTLSFYMLVVALGAAAGGMAALFGFDLRAQLGVAALIAVAGTVVVSRYRAQRTRVKNTVQNLDVGQLVTLEVKRPDGMMRVKYRGASWDARMASADLPTDSALYIQSIDGTTLVLGPTKPIA